MIPDNDKILPSIPSPVPAFLSASLHIPPRFRKFARRYVHLYKIKWKEQGGLYMKQIVLTVEDNSLVPKLKAAVKLLQGVVSVKVTEKEESPKPNKDTLEALEEIRSGKYAGKLDSSSKDALLESMRSL